MVTSVHGSVIPARFYATIGHFILLVMIFYSKGDNITASLSSGYSASDYNSANSVFVIGLAVALALIGVEMVGLFGGLTIFALHLNVTHTVLHFIGVITLSLFILQTWSYTAYWPIFVITSIIPGILEICTLIVMFGCNVVEW
eukprot:gnl/Hemi2/15380_TR5177_c0_g2_i1.p1 gnl/Hemi2/15380_TR5177_c0_g2~~gnl/Hemi2/15380_TR5177_c0_g2_i1.p1  ORF type:complete len:154 (+),score=18.90 gnl/Hemi2/15380_TR5177_c0_g2_i1:36-464(+)